MSNQEPSLNFNNRTIPVYLGILALATALYSGVSAVNAYAFQVDKVQTEQSQISEAVTELKMSVSGLDKSITSLTIVLNRLEDRYDVIQNRVDAIEQRTQKK